MILWLFVFFFVSGFCSILYEIVWLRLAMAQFGVTTPLVSIVLSMFMAGLGLGSWGSGRLIQRLQRSERVHPLRCYAITELMIGLSALAVPYELQWGRDLLRHIPSFSSWAYHLASGAMVAGTIVPWCAFMGATIPVGMWVIRRLFGQERRRSFSFLYLANVLGALAGAILPLFLIEIYGFRGSLRTGAVLNASLAAVAAALSLHRSLSPQKIFAEEPGLKESPPVQASARMSLILLFTAGLTTMGIEVVWVRQFTPYLGTLVYAFAAILGLYLASTFLGSHAYRYWVRKYQVPGQILWLLAGLFTVLPLLSTDPYIGLSPVWRLALGIVPISALFGFLTPMLVDQWSGGDPGRAGRAYAVNIIGCILGPLISNFALLPFLSEHWTLVIYALAWFAFGAFPDLMSALNRNRGAVTRGIWKLAAVALPAFLVVAIAKPFESNFPGSVVLRDSTATIIGGGHNLKKQLLVNGVGITLLSPITKTMAHLPLAFLGRPPQNALVVCFGMGTSYRSMLSWNIATTAVELVPSVPKMFWFFHQDGPQLLRSHLSKVVIDDGRRYLERSPDLYDVITVDPPPPVEAAGSSLLYSVEFNSICKSRLRDGGILQQWLPEGDGVVRAAVARALKECFPYVRAFTSLEGWGVHFLASTVPILDRSPADLVRSMPETAMRDLTEWGPEPTPERQYARILHGEVPLDGIIAKAPEAAALRDDRPQNEYFALRRIHHRN